MSDTRLDVPTGSFYGGYLSITGRFDEFPQTPAATSFPALLAAIRDAPHNNELAVELHLSGAEGERSVQSTIVMGDTVTGSRGYPVTAD